MAPIQQAMETAPVHLGSLLDAGDGAVVTLLAGDTRLAAHRAVLMDRSPVFAAFFGHDILEAGSGEVSIPDIEGPVMRQLLAFLYTLQTPQLPDMAFHLLAAADKYGVSALKAACEQKVAAQISVETAAATAVLAVRHSCESLKKTAINFVKANFAQVMTTEGWADAVCMHPDDVVEVSRLVGDLPTETSAPAPADSGASTCTPASAATQQHSGDRSGHSGAPASAAPPRATAASRNTPPPEDDAVSRLRSLPDEEKGRRLIQAAKQGAVGELEALLAAGADVAATDGERRTGLDWAAAEGHVVAARRLIACGAAVDARNKWDATPLHRAAANGHTSVVRLLLDASAYHSARQQLGWTPLHCAAFFGHTEAAAALLEAGADREARNNGGETPLDTARQNNHQQLVNLLSRR